ncbi:MAG: outer membrane beta-barrel protein [Proteobacteria bacterium]|nr:outer membrane beta-barrel protein [Pseudomonadota bacterium]
MGNGRGRGLLVGLLAGVLCSAAGAAHAADGRFYIGASGTAEQFDASYDKSVINTPPSLRSGDVFHDGDSADDWDIGLGLLLGYRLPLGADGSFFLSAELDAKLHDVTTRGRLEGVGDSATRNQLGESWPDDWSLEKERSYGLTVKLGADPVFLRPFLGETSLYLLAGLRLVDTKFEIEYDGCFRVAPLCVPAEFEAGSLSRSQDFVAWTGGVGLEKRFGEHLALQGEVRYTGYADEDWLSFDLDGIQVPAELDGDDLDLSLNLILFF